MCTQADSCIMCTTPILHAPKQPPEAGTEVVASAKEETIICCSQSSHGSPRIQVIK